MHRKGYFRQWHRGLWSERYPVTTILTKWRKYQNNTTVKSKQYGNTKLLNYKTGKVKINYDHTKFRK